MSLGRLHDRNVKFSPVLVKANPIIFSVTLVVGQTKVAGVKIIRHIAEMQSTAAALKRAGRRLALVPTMGALHTGHATLMRRARAGGAATVVSIYVNPTQFGPHEDFNRYPRNMEADAALCAGESVDIIFAPLDAEMYAGNAASTWVEETTLAKQLEGERRPGHFRGVCTVVAKLFNIVQPDSAAFGQKDFQQLAVITRMVRDLGYPIEILPVPIVREADGLALSSRNRYLNPTERAQATILWQALSAAQKLFATGEHRAAPLQASLLRTLQLAPAIRLDYAEIVSGATLEPVTDVQTGAVALLAAHLGQTRLIDNAIF